MPTRAPRCLGSAAIVISGLGRGLEQEIVDYRLVLVGDIGDGRWQREDHVEVRQRQQLSLALSQPLLRGNACRSGRTEAFDPRLAMWRAEGATVTVATDR
jgi:hypothetical protein